MGNVLEPKMFREKPLPVVPPMPGEESKSELEAEAAEEEDSPKTTVSFHLFHYRQQIALKENHVAKWANSKLLLTEELLKQNLHTQSNHLDLQNFDDDDDDDDASWANKQLALLTDDEDDENMENLSPTWDRELNELVRYRSKLRETIIQESQDKLRKREKTKLKRLKRRLLISSKKPSKKNKH